MATTRYSAQVSRRLRQTNIGHSNKTLSLHLFFGTLKLFSEGIGNWLFGSESFLFLMYCWYFMKTVLENSKFNWGGIDFYFVWHLLHSNTFWPLNTNVKKGRFQMDLCVKKNWRWFCAVFVRIFCQNCTSNLINVHFSTKLVLYLRSMFLLPFNLIKHSSFSRC